MLHVPPFVKLFQVLRIARRQLAVNLQAGIGPAANPFAVMQVRVRRVAVARVRLVIAAAGAQRTRPAPAAIGLVVDVMLLQKPDLHQPVDAVAHRAQLVRVGAGEAMAQRHVAIGGDAHQPQSRAARIRLADAFVDLFQRVLHVGEAVMPVLQRCFQELGGQRLELLAACCRSRSSAMAYSRFGAVVTGANPTSQNPISSRRWRKILRMSRCLRGQRDARADRAACGAARSSSRILGATMS